MSNVDLSALSMGPAATSMPRRPWGPRLLVIGSLLLVAATALTFVWPVLRPGRAVPMANVRAIAVAGLAAAPLAEAVGWIEADPFPIVVRPLVAGRIESIAVLEGTPVKAGETVLATLQGAALQAAKDRAAASCAERERMADAAVAAHALAVARLAQNAEARLAVTEARATLAEKTAQLAVATSNVVRMRAELRSTNAAVAAQEQLQAAGSSNTLALERVRASAAAAEAALAAAEAEATGARNEQEVAAARVALAEELAAKPVDLEGAVATATAEVARARANCAAGRTDLAIAERELAWTTVKAPCDGVVLRLLAMPGGTTGPDSEGILSIYDPARLRARIDVPLGSMGTITVDQDVDLRSEVTGALIVRGVVQRIQHEADLLKNTLQVKVRIVDPPPLWRPETLCRARFLGGARAATTPEAAFLVPKAALRGSEVFVFDPRQRCARAVAVTQVGEQGDDVVVRGELSVAQKVVLVPVTAGESLREVAP